MKACVPDVFVLFTVVMSQGGKFCKYKKSLYALWLLSDETTVSIDRSTLYTLYGLLVTSGQTGL